MENIIETRTCLCWNKFDITDKDAELLKKLSPTIAWVKYEIPFPTLCPTCRNQRRFTYRNERNLYKRVCDATGKPIISIYSPDKPYKVYEQTEWWSDKWDPKAYWKEFDFTKSFFEQFQELRLQVPRWSLLNWFNENSDYANHAAKQKNYSNFVVDSSWIKNSEYIYSSTDVKRSFKCLYCNRIDNCSESMLLIDCDWCVNCIGCTNQKNQKFMILNESVTPEEFESAMQKMKNDMVFREDMFEKFRKLYLETPRKALNNKNIENSSWDYLVDTKDSKNVFHMTWCENMRHCSFAYDAKDCMDYDVWWDKTSLVYETHCTWWIEEWVWCSNILFSNVIWGGSFVTYSDNCSNCHNLFGCVWLHGNESYCILNKQYSKEEYEAMIPKIIEHMKKTKEWWEFFPASMSTYWYNETVASEYYPLTKSEVLSKWFKWSDFEWSTPAVSKIIPWSKLPFDIKEIPDDVVNWAIECENSGKPFRIIKQELDFYRKLSLPLPRMHPDERHKRRIAQRISRKLYDRKCDNCGIDIKTTYSPQSQEIIFCDKCYNEKFN